MRRGLPRATHRESARTRVGRSYKPAISFAMWRFSVFPGRSVLPYALPPTSRLAFGAFATYIVWGKPVADPGVAYAAIQAALGLSGIALFAGGRLVRSHRAGCGPVLSDAATFRVRAVGGGRDDRVWP